MPGARAQLDHWDLHIRWRLQPPRACPQQGLAPLCKAAVLVLVLVLVAAAAAVVLAVVMLVRLGLLLRAAVALWRVGAMLQMLPE